MKLTDASAGLGDAETLALNLMGPKVSSIAGSGDPESDPSLSGHDGEITPNVEPDNGDKLVMHCPKAGLGDTLPELARYVAPGDWRTQVRLPTEVLGLRSVLVFPFP